MWAGEYVGIPFMEKGRSRAGCDCWGLVRLVYHDKLQVDLPSFHERYSDSNDRKVLEQLIEAEKNAKWLAVEKPKPYDVVVLKMLGMPTHVGIVVNPRLMLHVMQGTNAVLEDFTNLKWRHRIQGFARWQT